MSHCRDFLKCEEIREDFRSKDMHISTTEFKHLTSVVLIVSFH